MVNIRLIIGHELSVSDTNSISTELVVTVNVCLNSV